MRLRASISETWPITLPLSQCIFHPTSFWNKTPWITRFLVGPQKANLPNHLHRLTAFRPTGPFTASSTASRLQRSPVMYLMACRYPRSHCALRGTQARPLNGIEADPTKNDLKKNTPHVSKVPLKVHLQVSVPLVSSKLWTLDTCQEYSQYE